MFPALSYLYNPNGTKYINRGQYRSTGWAGSLGEFGSLLQQRVQQMAKYINRSAMNFYTGRTASQIGGGLRSFVTGLPSAWSSLRYDAQEYYNPSAPMPVSSFTSPAGARSGPFLPTSIGTVNLQQRPQAEVPMSSGTVNLQQRQIQSRQGRYSEVPYEQMVEDIAGVRLGRIGQNKKQKQSTIQDKAYWRERAIAEGRSPDYYAGRGAGKYDEETGRFYHAFNQANYQYYGTGRGGEGEPNYERSGGDPRWWLKGKRGGGGGRRRQQGEPPVSAISNYSINWRVGAG